MKTAPPSEAVSRPSQPTRAETRHILTLPVAPRACARIRFAPLPTTATAAMLPQEAMAWLERCLQQGRIDGVEIAGPGDPLASIEASLAILGLISEKYPELPLSLTTLGFGGEHSAGPLRQAGLREVKILVNAVDPACLEKIYAWIRPGTKTLPLPKAARILVDEQQRAVTAFKKAGMTVHIGTTVFPDNNTDHLEAIARSMAAGGADGMILAPYLPEEGSDFALPAADAAMMAEAAQICRRHLPVLADNKGQLSTGQQVDAKPCLPQPSKQRPNVAVASSSGMDVDLHLGQAKQLLIYGPREDGLTCLLETRPAPEPGALGKRWQVLAAGLTDCFALLAASAGETPRRELALEGITVLITEDNIAGTVDVLYGGGKKGKQCRK